MWALIIIKQITVLIQPGKFKRLKPTKISKALSGDSTKSKYYSSGFSVVSFAQKKQGKEKEH